MRTLLAVVLLVLFSAPLPAAPEWHDSMTAGQRAAAASRKPILCVIFKAGERASSKLQRDLGTNRKLTALLDRFVLVRLDRSRNAALVSRYGLKHSPATVFFTPGGSPMKTIVGGVSVNRYATEMQAALDKYAELLRPRRPKTERRETPSDDAGPELRHSGSCPDGCEHCGPVVNAALDWLLKQQASDGRFAKPKSERVTRSEDGRVVTRSIDHVDVALTATSGLALIAAGVRPGEDRRGRALAKADGFVTQAVREDGVICGRTDDDYLYLVHANFETSLGAVFLAEMEKVAPDRDRRKAMERVRDYLERTQDPATGAWGYGPDFRSHSPRTRRGYRLLATTHSVLTALNHLARTGLEVDDGVRKKAAHYLLSCRGRDGAFTYRAEFRMLPGYPGASAGAYFALARSGLVGEAELESIFGRYRRDYRRFELYRPLTTTIGKHWWFFLLQTALAMYDRGPAAFDDFQRGFRDRLVRAQQPNGRFEDPDGNAGSVFATSIAALALTMGRNRLPIAADRALPPVTTIVAKPKYIVPPHPESRVKVFRHEGVYLADLVVWVNGAADRAYFESLSRGIEGANRILFDVTDGQMRMHRVVLTADPKREKDADILITKDFYDREVNPRPWAHGITRVSKRTEIRGRNERDGARIGDWIMFPYHGRGTADVIRWDDSRFVHVLAHELCHYLFGLRDEYHAMSGESFCECIMGKRRATELCREETHTDDRRDGACWTLAKRLYPAMKIPETPDAGPWRPKRPVVVLP